MYKKNYFNFKKIKHKYLLTNDFGNFIFLSSKYFGSLIQSEKLPVKVLEELKNKQFVYEEEDSLFVKMHSDKLREYKGYLKEGTVLHIFVVSKNCNYSCVYCQAGNLSQNITFVMNEEVARNAVDIAFESPSKDISFEFQGGEPLLNFSIIQYIVTYSKKKNENMEEDKRKNIEYQIVSNLSLLTDEMIDFIVKNGITICTSIDGDKKLQNQNRPCGTCNSYDATISGLKRLQQEKVPISALLTTTRESLMKSNEIVEEYVKLGLNRIVVRPLTKLGKAADVWSEIGYTSEEFINFYRKI